jgi:hypothetical protein
MSDAQMDEIMAKLKAEEEEGQDEVVYAGYTRRELDTAFKAIQDPTNWKLELRGEILEDDYDRTNAAAIFYAGSPLRGVRVPDKPGMVSVYGSGYYVNIGA